MWHVSALETVISKGGKVVEIDVLKFTELLMNQLVKLEGITIADGDVKLQRKIQAKRIQKYVEILDMIKMKNSKAKANGNDTTTERPQREFYSSPSQSRRSSSGDVFNTTQWETFDSTPTPSLTRPPVAASHSVSSTATPTTNVAQPRFDWDLLL
ncbi:chaperone [Lithospermum erythrorhizon]|uniref:Chaperone n=1 Tax=Lithospermum erythrorhizon TaxID=34254 RepID=A0AAV3PWQ5_LITER